MLRQDVVVDEVGKVSRVSRFMAERSGEDRRRKHANAIGAEILKKPWNRGKDRGAQIGFVEQRRNVSRRLGSDRLSEFHMMGIGWLAREEPRDLSLRVFMPAPDKQPVLRSQGSKSGRW